MSVSRFLRIVRQRFRALWRRDTLDSELDRELAFHLEQLTSEYVADGMTPDEARHAARRELGNLPLVAEQCQDQRRVGWVTDLRQDLSYGVRLLRKNPGFTCLVVASLALGIGANTAVLGVMDALLRQGLPVPDDDRVVVIRTYPQGNPQQETHASLLEYFAWMDQNRTFDAVSVALGNQADFGSDVDGAPAERIQGHQVTAVMFGVLRVQPHLGRVLTESDGPGTAAEPGGIVISYRLWQRRFGAAADILGRQVRFNGVPRVIVGVMPEGFHYPNDVVDYWLPMRPSRAGVSGPERFYVVNARLKDGVSIQQAQADVDRIAAQLARERPDRQAGWSVRVRSLRDAMFGWTREPLLTFGAAVLLVLLVACANVAGLLLARGLVREPEVALRVALGAGRGRLVRQLLTESLVLSGAGGLVGLLVAWASARALLLASPPPGGVSVSGAGFDLPLLGVMALLSIGTGLVFGVAPAVIGSRAEATAIKESSGPGGSRAQPRVRAILVTAQIAMTFVLLISTALLIKSFLTLVNRDLHFNVERLMTFELNRPISEFMRGRGTVNGLPYFEIAPSPALRMERVYQELSTIPGVSAVAASTVPLVNSLVVPTATISLDLSTPQVAPAPARALAVGIGGPEVHVGGADALAAAHILVTPDFFTSVEAEIVRGRDIERRDTVQSQWVAIVNESAARRFWPGEDPIGKQFRMPVVPDERPRTVVGVIRDIPLTVQQRTQQPAIYTPYFQQPTHYPLPGANMFGRMVFMVRTAGEPAQILPAARRIVARIDPDWPLGGVMTMEERLAAAGTRNRAEYVVVLAAFALTAALLAAIGVYGLMAYSVAQRTREIGIRIALGARSGEIVLRVSRQGLVLVTAGLFVGVGGSIAITPLLQSQLWDVAPTDPTTFAAVSAFLVLVCCLACFVPVRRAITLEPTRALRCE
jgi:putative ABC transport system permease protein